MHIRSARATARRYEERAVRLTGEVLALPGGGSVRQLGIMLGLSHQRIHLMYQQLSTVEGR
jgi:hypothetical protein